MLIKNHIVGSGLKYMFLLAKSCVQQWKATAVITHFSTLSLLQKLVTHEVDTESGILINRI